jgi:hypothetical protein
MSWKIVKLILDSYIHIHIASHKLPIIIIQLVMLTHKNNLIFYIHFLLQMIVR